MKLFKIALTTVFAVSLLTSIFSLLMLNGDLATIVIFIPIFGAYLILIGLTESVGGMKKDGSIKMLGGVVIIMFCVMYLFANAWHGG